MEPVRCTGSRVGLNDKWVLKPGTGRVVVALDCHHPRATTTVFPKNEEEARFSLNLGAGKATPAGRGIQGPESGTLTEELARLFAGGRRGWGVAIDLTHCYWSSLLPPGKRTLFRVARREHVWLFRSSPFGWSHSPLLCPRLLAHLTRVVGMEVAGEVVRWLHYLDGFLWYGRDAGAVAQNLEESTIATAASPAHGRACAAGGYASDAGGWLEMKWRWQLPPVGWR